MRKTIKEDMEKEKVKIATIWSQDGRYFFIPTRDANNVELMVFLEAWVDMQKDAIKGSLDKG